MSINRLSIVKFLELALTLTCVGLHYKSLGESGEHAIMLISGTFVGFSIILIALFAGYIMGTPINKRLDLFFCLIGCAMFIASGVLIIQQWEDALIKSETRKMALAKGGLAIINGIVFFFDVILTFRD